MNYVLDTGPLGLLAHERLAHNEPIQTWMTEEVAGGAKFFISEAADYEVRRELTRLIEAGKLPSTRLQRLDRLARMYTFLTVSTKMWKRAAIFWAEARSKGKPTAPDHALDIDVLIAAQAREINATVVTSNAAHIGRWVPVKPWP